MPPSRAAQRHTEGVKAHSGLFLLTIATVAHPHITQGIRAMNVLLSQALRYSDSGKVEGGQRLLDIPHGLVGCAE